MLSSFNWFIGSGGVPKKIDGNPVQAYHQTYNPGNKRPEKPINNYEKDREPGVV